MSRSTPSPVPAVSMPRQPDFPFVANESRLQPLQPVAASAAIDGFETQTPTFPGEPPDTVPPPPPTNPDEDEPPETPPTEPPPVPVVDPPSEPKKPPLVV